MTEQKLITQAIKFNYAFGYEKDFTQKLINTRFYNMDIDLQCDMLMLFFEGCWYQLKGKWHFQELYINKLEGIEN